MFVHILWRIISNTPCIGFMQGVFLCVDAISFGGLYFWRSAWVCWLVHGWKAACSVICLDFLLSFPEWLYAIENNRHKLVLPGIYFGIRSSIRSDLRGDAV